VHANPKIDLCSFIDNNTAIKIESRADASYHYPKLKSYADPIIKNCIFKQNKRGINIKAHSHHQWNQKNIYAYSNSKIENCIFYKNEIGMTLDTEAKYNGLHSYVNSTIKHSVFDSCSTAISIHSNHNKSEIILENSIILNCLVGIDNLKGKGIVAIALHNNNFFDNENSCKGCSLMFGRKDRINQNGTSCDLFYNIFEDPLFVSLENQNYQLQNKSLCIDAGYSNSENKDFCFPPSAKKEITDIGIFGGLNACAWKMQNLNEIHTSDQLDFGIIPIGTELTKTVTISNPNDLSIVILSLQINSDNSKFTVQNTAPYFLSAFSNIQIPVCFYSDDKGQFNDYLFINSNQGNRTLILKSKAMFENGFGGIKGKVLTNITGKLTSIVGAKITIEKTDYSTESDYEGKFSFYNIPSGKYSISIEKKFLKKLVLNGITVEEEKTYQLSDQEMFIQYDNIQSDYTCNFVDINDSSEDIKSSNIRILKSENSLGSASGCVLSSVTGKKDSISGIKVSLLSLNQSTITDDNGNFYFDYIPAGMYQLLMELNSLKIIVKNFTVYDSMLSHVSVKEFFNNEINQYDWNALPGIKRLSYPPFGNRIQNIEGITNVSNPTNNHIVVCIFKSGAWFTRPYEKSVINLHDDGSFSCDVTKKYEDMNASEIAIFLLKNSYSPQIINGDIDLPKEIFLNSVDNVHIYRKNNNLRFNTQK